MRTLSTFNDWRHKYPEAAKALVEMLERTLTPESKKLDGATEAPRLINTRFSIAKQGAFSFRNNVGATPAKCKKCGAKSNPVRYGLANDSIQMNHRVKSSDLILIIPRLITPDMVGRTIGQFGAVECKRESWEWVGTSERDRGQAAWLAFVEDKGGFAAYSKGFVDLSKW
jgi:hypothetical protein